MMMNEENARERKVLLTTKILKSSAPASFVIAPTAAHIEKSNTVSINDAFGVVQYRQKMTTIMNCAEKAR